jgi:hypothetical protein
VAAIAAALAMALVDGCAHRPPGSRHEPGILVDTVRTLPRPAPAPSTSSLRSATLHDTSYVSGVLRRCGNRQLLPDQESTRETLLSMLAQAREALAAGDVERAHSAARNARQLATSLRCP